MEVMGLNEVMLNRDHVKLCMECRCHLCREMCTQYIETRNSVNTAYGTYIIAFAYQLGLIEPTRELAEHFLYCTTCGLCKYRCTVSLKGAFYRKIMDVPKHVAEIRAFLNEKVGIPYKAGIILDNLRKFNNPQGTLKAFVNLENVKDPLNEKVSIIFYMGYSAYDRRNSKALEAAIDILKNSGVDFGILRKEPNSGDLALRLGDVGLFEIFKERNLEIFESTKAERIVTFSPHDFYTFKNDYKLKNVSHISVFLKELMDEGKIKVRKIGYRVIYKDPCYLGRHSGIFNEPRSIISSIAELEEFSANRYLALCCGGGSGHDVMGLEKKKINRVAKILANEAKERGVDTIAVACPSCTTMIESEGMRTKNITEIVREAMV